MIALIVSDIHANLAALETVLLDAKPSGYETIWCLGDLTGYGPRPNECISVLRSQPHPLVCVAGNHDWACLGKISLDDFNPDARRACEWAISALSDEHRKFLEELPVASLQGNYTLVHGSPRHPIWEYVLYPDLAASNFAYYQTAFCLVGHTHVPAMFQKSETPDQANSISVVFDGPIPLAGSRAIINPGSVGQPRDGDARASYALLDTEKDEITYRRVAYPLDVTQRQMVQLNLPPRLVARLEYGW
jgi:predicted phosphodiesterase